MKYIVDEIVNLIVNKAVDTQNETMIRVDGFESVELYEKIAQKTKQVLSGKGITSEIRLAKNKWDEFSKNSDNSTVLQSMKQNGWVAEAQSITFYRNLHNSNVLVLLGTEDEEDKGGLLNFYSITPDKLVKNLNGKYHKVFLNEIESLGDDDKDIVDRLYKYLFEFVPKDICKLSDIIDSWSGQIVNIRDFYELFFEALPLWGLEKQKYDLPVDKKGNLNKNCLRSNYNFINRNLFSKMSMPQYKKYMAKIDYYPKAELAKFNSDHECWSDQKVNNYDDLAVVLKEFIGGENVEENRKLLIGVDFAIIEDVLGIGIPVEKKPPKNKVTSLVGEPLEVFTQALFLVLNHLSEEDIHVEEIVFEFVQAELVCMYSNTDDDEGAQQLHNTWSNICIHCNDVIEYINKRMWQVNGNDVSLVSEPEQFFSPKNATLNIENSRVKAASANKKISKISFNVKYKYKDKDFIHEFQWKFNEVNSWCGDFSDICNDEYYDKYAGNYIPIATISKINSLIFAKSDEEFFDRLNESDISFDFNLSDYVDKRIPSSENEISARFYEVGKAFYDFIKCIKEEGFYSCIGKDMSELAILVNKYVSLGEKLTKRSFPENLKWILDVYIQSFNIIKDTKCFDSDIETDCCIVPAWHPATLEKLNDQKIFFLDGCQEWWNERQGNKITKKEIEDTINSLVQMSTIQSPLDILPSYSQQYYGNVASYGAYGLYGRSDLKNDNRLKDMIHKDAIYDDDFDSKEISRLNDNAKMIYGVIDDYVKAFPNSMNNLSIVFVDPSELQPIIAAVYKYIDVCRDKNKDARIDITLKILVKPENKGGRNYLAYWMDEFFSQDANVNIRTYLNEWKNKSELEKILNGNNDIAFVMDLLKINSLTFVPAKNNSSLSASQCRYPIVFKPTPISSTSVKRSIELSQPQFNAAYEHTQVVRYRNNLEKIPDEKYIAAKEVGIDLEGQSIVHFLHEKAYWVVCVDSGMDGALLRSDSQHGNDYSIIGFSTGKGSYGQYNLTITARKTILDTIRIRLENRLYQLFKWESTKIKGAASICLEEASGLDGISLLSAVNQRDHNINEFMAYVLTSLREGKIGSDSALKIVIHLDSYKHWFGNEIDKDEEASASRPDFLVLEAFMTNDEKLKLKATVTECKISTENNSSTHKDKAVKQVEHGIKVLSDLFNPESRSIKRRYWFAQLYRALAFAQVTFSNDKPEFSEISAKLRTVLDGNFEIEWQGRVLGYWVDKDGESETNTIIKSDDIVIEVVDIPQKTIQGLLLKKEEAELEYVNVGAYGFVDDEEQNAEIEMREKELDEDEESIKNTPDLSVTNNDETNVSSISDSSEKKEDDTNINQHNNNINTDNTKGVSLENIRVLIGNDKAGNDVFWEFGNPLLANRHLLITGTSGQGKTYSIQTMQYELSKANISSVVFDYTEGFRLDQLEPEFVGSMKDQINEHIVKIEGVPINPFKKQELDFGNRVIPEDSSDVAGRFANILTHVYKFGEQQHAAIYEATRIGLEKYGDEMNMEHFKEELEDVQNSNSSAKTVVSKMTPFFHSIKFDKEADFDWGELLYSDEAKMNIFQLTMIDREMQVVVTELMLWDAWYYTKKFGKKDKPFVVVLDEAQNLSHKENSPSKAILTEGRKFGWSAWFATQSLRVLADDEVVRLLQSAFKLYFKPTDEEVIKMSKQLDPTNASLWLGALKTLRKGQCIAVGERIRNDGQFGAVKPTVTNIISFAERDNNE